MSVLVSGDTALLGSVSSELPENDAALSQWRDGFKDLHLFIAYRLAVRSNGRVHSQVGQHLKQMVLHYVPDGAGLMVKATAPLNSRIFGPM